MKKTSGLRAVLTLFIITAVIALLLALVNGITAQRIAQAQEEKTREALSAVLEEGMTLGERLPDFPDPSEGMIQSAYEASGGYVFIVNTAGYGGNIAMTVGVNEAGEVTGVEIISHGETPALGERAVKGSSGELFRSQYLGAREPMSVNKDGGTIEAISGATMTSRGITQGVNAALECAGALKGGAQ